MPSAFLRTNLKGDIMTLSLVSPSHSFHFAFDMKREASAILNTCWTGNKICDSLNQTPFPKAFPSLNTFML